MRLATLKRGGRDGTLVVVGPDGDRVREVRGFSTLQEALENWSDAFAACRQAEAELLESGEDVEPAEFAAPLPRSWQWLDGSAFATHGELMQAAFKLPPIQSERPLMYQGMSHQFIGPVDDVVLPSELDGIDFEGEFGVVTGDVPIGCPPEQAINHVRLIVMINDWSLRSIAPIEMKTGFGWVQAKPACSMAPFAITPDELGDRWREGRVCLPLVVELNGKRFGSPSGDAMEYGFHELIAHAARTRSLPAGTVIGSGTVSNEDHDAVGSTCISERRAIETIARGEPLTDFIKFGDRVAMGSPESRSLFGRIDQRVVGLPPR